MSSGKMRFPPWVQVCEGLDAGAAEAAGTAIALTAIAMGPTTNDNFFNNFILVLLLVVAAAGTPARAPN
jgi:hypothetical protein